jgi:dGTPase
LAPPLEAQLIDWVDEIAYNTADLDDGVEAGLITIEQILAGVPLVNNFYREIESQHPNARAQLIFNEALKRTLDHFATDLIESTRRQIISTGVATVDDVRHYPAGQGVPPVSLLAGLSNDAHDATLKLKKFLFANLYNHPAIVEDRDRGVAALDELFRYYMDHPNAMPAFYAAEATAPASAGGRAPHLVVCDYVAGMTDHFLLRTHRELLDH